MSDWKREDDHDEPLSPAHRLLDERMASIERDLIGHTHPQIDKIIEILDGPLVEDLDGHVSRDVSQGLRFQVDKVNAKIDQVLLNQGASTVKKILAAFGGGIGLSWLTVWTRAWEWIT